MMWTALITGATKLAGSWINKRAEKSQAVHEAKIEQIRARTSADEHSAQGMATSWKDEYLVLLLTAPLIIIFYATMTENFQMIAAIKDGFTTMASLPEFYQWALMGAIASSFGIRSFERIKGG